MLINVIKCILVLAIMFILAYPLIPTKKKSKFFVFSKLKYKAPHNKKNIFFVLLAIVEFLVVATVFESFDTLAQKLGSIPVVNNLISSVVKLINSQPQLNYIFFTIKLILINVILLYGFFIVKAFLKNVVLDNAYSLKSKKEKKAQDENDETTDEEKADAEKKEEEDKKNRKKLRIPDFIHSSEKSDEECAEEDILDLEDDEEKSEKKYYNPVEAFILGLFFEGDEYQYARDWVVRTRIILQSFIVLVEITYLLFFLIVLLSLFFPLPMKLYSFLLFTLHLGDWYIYPVISVVFLQEICNIFKGKSRSQVEEEEKKKTQIEKKENEDLEERLRKLLNALKKHFDSEHSLRYYPEAVQEEIPEYIPTNQTYKSALSYIGKRMKIISGRVVQSYMQCLDASFNNEHVYFASSFYSELGEYLITYTYIRLLSGSRVVFIVSDPDERATLRSFISERLMQLTGTSKGYGWRIYTSNERLDQADILIASPDDFRDGDLTSQYSDFFEEVSNAIFLDADKIISLDSYLCPVMANCLKKSTNNRIRFIFLTMDLYKGFAARSLPRFFCVEPVLSFSSAKENESVSYVLWNRESKSHRIYNKHGQKTTCLECMIAELACKSKIDGVRLITQSSLDHAEQKLLMNYGVEINKLYRDVVDVNYMIYSDERSNLAASMYACTRFRGKKKSVVHIISKPYLLREYFISKASTENFVNRSSFIQPRILEHVDQHKLSLLRVFCKLTFENGLTLTDFHNEMCEVINICADSGYIISSAFCKKMLSEKKAEQLKTGELASYLIAGLCDNDIYHDDHEMEICAHNSIGHNAKEYYLIIDPTKNDGFTFHREKYIIFNRAKEIYEMLFSCNKRVELRLNNEVIGHLDTFPIRTHLQYIAGQSIVYKNSEYEIEHISEDGKTVYLRNENVKIKHCLSTVHLRRYEMNSITPIPKHLGVLTNTKLNINEIRVTECFAKFVGETYGFYGLTSDKQTLDFYHKDGVDGNSHVAKPHRRDIADGRVLKVELLTRMECNDKMRLLLAAVFNEFVRTIFPEAYHFISIVPVLAEPLGFNSENEPSTELERITALYPYLVSPKEEFIETDSNRITLLFINDCYDDVGAFQWFYDLSGRYMQEFLANIYSYLHWLQIRPEKEHYIYFGGEALPECYDLDGCCTLLEGFNLILSDLEDHDIETAGNDLIYDKIERCSFCHKEMESGRYSFFDNARYICANCHDTVETAEHINSLYSQVKKYLDQVYPDIVIGGAKVDLDPIYDLTADQVLSEYYYRTDFTERVIFAERDQPADNVRVSILRGLIEMWQSDNRYFMEYSKAQLYYEELLYLHSLGLDESAIWIYNALEESLKAQVDEIAKYTGCPAIYPAENPDEPTTTDDCRDAVTDVCQETENECDSEQIEENNSSEAQNTQGETEQNKLTSFDFIRMKYKESLPPEQNDEIDTSNSSDEDKFSGLYNPNKIPRFWKRYLRHEKLDDGKNEDVVTADDSVESDDNDGDFTVDTDIDINTENQTEVDNLHNTDTDDQTPTQTDGVANHSDVQNPPALPTESKKKKKRRGLFGKKLTPGEKMQPYEEDEATNPRIKVYNEIVRHSYDYSEELIDKCGLSTDEIIQILLYVLGDYPELFWVTRSIYDYESQFMLCFRCKTAGGELDIKQINSKRNAIRKAAKKFTKGINKNTDPYTALTTIYRRLILKTDYDSANISSNVSNDEQQDDRLRSLYSALVNHKVVCAGYAVAMQYLLQSVGIVCGYVISEFNSDNIRHAFNILKIGKYCYYLDSTWGDLSNTETGNEYKDLILYDYFCVPYNEFLLTAPSTVPMHVPKAEYYPDIETFNYTNHEYYRFHNAYLASYNEAEVIRIIAEAADRYEPKEMGEFTVGIRFANQSAANIAYNMMQNKDTIRRLILSAMNEVTKKGKAALLERKFGILPVTETGVLYIRFLNE